MVELGDLIRPGEGRGLDFVVTGQLPKRTSLVPSVILKFAVSEMIIEGHHFYSKLCFTEWKWRRERGADI